MPYMEDPNHDNYRWKYIKNEFLVRLVHDDQIYWFIIHAPKKKRSNKSVDNTVSCTDICSTLKTKNLYAEFDGDTTGIGTIRQ